MDIICIDFTKAFDKINIEILLQKLKTDNLLNDIFLIIVNLLRDRQQCVRVGDSISLFMNVTSGVPHGSVLSSSLFAVFLDDLMNADIGSNINSYADDLSLLGYREQIFNVILTQ